MLFDFFAPFLPRKREYWEHPSTNGNTNPLRWNCERSGCFNKVKRPKLELFANCFPSSCQMSDIDGEVEVNSHWLRLEWKSLKDIDRGLPRGQAINYEHLTLHCPRHTVLVVYGDAEHMTVEKVDMYWKGSLKRDWHEIRTLDRLQALMMDWAEKARTNAL